MAKPARPLLLVCVTLLSTLSLSTEVLNLTMTRYGSASRSNGTCAIPPTSGESASGVAAFPQFATRDEIAVLLGEIRRRCAFRKTMRRRAEDCILQTSSNDAIAALNDKLLAIVLPRRCGFKPQELPVRMLNLEVPEEKLHRDVGPSWTILLHLSQGATCFASSPGSSNAVGSSASGQCHLHSPGDVFLWWNDGLGPLHRTKLPLAGSKLVLNLGLFAESFAACEGLRISGAGLDIQARPSYEGGPYQSSEAGPYYDGEPYQSSEACSDLVPEGVDQWFAEGSGLDCHGFLEIGCEGRDANEVSYGYTALQACCSCGGGSTAQVPTAVPSTVPMTLAVTTTTPEACTDIVPEGIDEWVAEGSGLNCKGFYEYGCEGQIALEISYGYTALQACCVCGGGSLVQVPTPVPTTMTTTLAATTTTPEACTDLVPKGFEEWFAEGSGLACKDFYEYGCEGEIASEISYGYTALQACCVCGGGSSVEACSDIVPEGQTEWSLFGEVTCDYVTSNHCNPELLGEFLFIESAGYTALQACCACGGGAIALTSTTAAAASTTATTTATTVTTTGTTATTTGTTATTTATTASTTATTASTTGTTATTTASTATTTATTVTTTATTATTTASTETTTATTATITQTTATTTATTATTTATTTGTTATTTATTATTTATTTGTTATTTATTATTTGTTATTTATTVTTTGTTATTTATTATSTTGTTATTTATTDTTTGTTPTTTGTTATTTGTTATTTATTATTTGTTATTTATTATTTGTTATTTATTATTTGTTATTTATTDSTTGTTPTTTVTTATTTGTTATTTATTATTTETTATRTGTTATTTGTTATSTATTATSTGTTVTITATTATTTGTTATTTETTATTTGTTATTTATTDTTTRTTATTTATTATTSGTTATTTATTATTTGTTATTTVTTATMTGTTATTTVTTATTTGTTATTTVSTATTTGTTRTTTVTTATTTGTTATTTATTATTTGTTATTTETTATTTGTTSTPTGTTATTTGSTTTTTPTTATTTATTATTTGTTGTTTGTTATTTATIVTTTGTTATTTVTTATTTATTATTTATTATTTGTTATTTATTATTTGTTATTTATTATTTGTTGTTTATTATSTVTTTTTTATTATTTGTTATTTATTATTTGTTTTTTHTTATTTGTTASTTATTATTTGTTATTTATTGTTTGTTATTTATIVTTTGTTETTTVTTATTTGTTATTSATTATTTKTTATTTPTTDTTTGTTATTTATTATTTGTTATTTMTTATTTGTTGTTTPTTATNTGTTATTTATTATTTVTTVTSTATTATTTGTTATTTVSTDTATGTTPTTTVTTATSTRTTATTTWTTDTTTGTTGTTTVTTATTTVTSRALDPSITITTTETSTFTQAVLIYNLTAFASSWAVREIQLWSEGLEVDTSNIVCVAISSGYFGTASGDCAAAFRDDEEFWSWTANLTVLEEKKKPAWISWEGSLFDSIRVNHWDDGSSILSVEVSTLDGTSWQFSGDLEARRRSVQAPGTRRLSDDVIFTWAEFVIDTEQILEVFAGTPAPSPACVDLVPVHQATWADSSGDTCADYEGNGWCALYGDLVDPFTGEPLSAGAEGVEYTANQACCACGGGSLLENLQDVRENLVMFGVTTIERLNNTNATREVVVYDVGTVLFELVQQEQVENNGGEVLVVVDNTKASVTVNNAVFDAVGTKNMYVVVAVVNNTFLQEVDQANTEALHLQPRGVISVNFFSADTGEKLVVEDLAEALTLTLPAKYENGVRCGYVNEHVTTWQFDGVTTATSEDGYVVCTATHLTLFGAIYQGLLQTLICTQVHLIDWDAIKLIGKGDWYLEPAPILFWCLCLFYIVMLVVARFLDHNRLAMWTDEEFLMPVKEELEDGTFSAAMASRSLGMNSHYTNRSGVSSAASSEAPPSRCRRVCGAVREQVNVIASSAAFKEALDDWIGNVGDYGVWIYHLLEAILAPPTVEEEDTSPQGKKKRKSGSLQLSGSSSSSIGTPTSQVPEGRLMRMLHVSMQVSLMNNARHHASVELLVSPIDLKYIAQDKVACDLLFKERAATQSEVDLESKKSRIFGVYGQRQSTSDITLGNSDTSRLSRSGSGSTKVANVAKQLRQVHRQLHHQTGQGLRKAASWRSLPSFVFRHLRAGNPISAALLPSIFISSSLRTLFLACETYGTLLIATLLFEQTGGLSSRGNDVDCDVEKNLWNEIGRLFTIATLAAVFTEGPVLFLYALHSRKFKQLEYKRWHRQLRAWRTQDTLIWVLGLLYVAACSLFIMTFLANVSTADLGEWLAGALLSLVEDFLVIPLVIAVFLPSLAMCLLAHVSWSQRIHKENVVIAVHRASVPSRASSRKSTLTKKDLLFDSNSSTSPFKSRGVLEDDNVSETGMTASMTLEPHGPGLPARGFRVRIGDSLDTAPGEQLRDTVSPPEIVSDVRPTRCRL